MSRTESRAKPHCLSITVLVIVIILIGGIAVAFSWYRDSQALALQESEIERLDVKIDLLRKHVDHHLDGSSGDPSDPKFMEALIELKEEIEKKLSSLDNRIELNEGKALEKLKNISSTKIISIAAIAAVGLLILFLAILIIIIICRRRRKDRSHP